MTCVSVGGPDLRSRTLLFDAIGHHFADEKK